MRQSIAFIMIMNKEVLKTVGNTFQQNLFVETLPGKKLGIFIKLFWRKSLGTHLLIYLITIQLKN